MSDFALLQTPWFVDGNEMFYFFASAGGAAGGAAGDFFASTSAFAFATVDTCKLTHGGEKREVK